VSKKKSAKKKRAAPARRKATRSRSSSRRLSSAAGPRPRKVQLKPIKVLVERALADLRRLPPAEATDLTIRHLETCSMALGDICDPNTPGGCGPSMEFLV
jgi:hypothetical protein